MNELEFKPFKCVECGRPNHPSASLCLWCGQLLSFDLKGTRFPTTIAELDYLNGIDRLDNPMPVRLTISADGIEVKEILPGTRIYQIGVAAIIEARVARRVDKVRIEKKISLLRKFLLDVSANHKRRIKEEFLRDHILTIWHRADDKICTAVFHREEDAGKLLINNVAKAINSLVKSHAAQKE